MFYDCLMPKHKYPFVKKFNSHELFLQNIPIRRKSITIGESPASVANISRSASFRLVWRNCLDWSRSCSAKPIKYGWSQRRTFNHKSFVNAADNVASRTLFPVSTAAVRANLTNNCIVINPKLYALNFFCFATSVLPKTNNKKGNLYNALAYVGCNA